MVTKQEIDGCIFVINQIELSFSVAKCFPGFQSSFNTNYKASQLTLQLQLLIVDSFLKKTIISHSL